MQQPNLGDTTGTLPSQSSGQQGIDNDNLPSSTFPSVGWLRQYNMHMYRWAGDNKEWTEYAMHLPRELINVVLGNDTKAGMAEIQRISRCEVWLDEETLGGNRERFIVFNRGSSGQPSNQSMLDALDTVSDIMRKWSSSSSLLSAPGQQSQPQPPPSAQQAPQQQQQSMNASSTQLLASRILGSGSSVPDVPVGGSKETAASLASSIFDLGLESELPLIDAKFVQKDRPELLKIPASGYVQRSLEIPREVVGLIIGQSGKKIKELCTESGAKIQFKVNKTAEREGRPGLLEVQGSAENVDKGLQLIWDLLQLLGKEYNEVLHPAYQSGTSTRAK